MTKKTMNPTCFKKRHIIENGHVHNEVVRLFNILDIPSKEQTVLWNMANKSIGCEKLRNLLILLQKTTT
jgi:hypothetical protein